MPRTLLNSMLVLAGLLLPAGPALAGKPDRPLERLQKMTPRQRQKALAKVPAQRREAIERRIATLDKLSPEERARVERFRALPPERQQTVRQAANRLSRLPPERQRAVKEELHRMGGLSSDQRTARMNAPEFRSQFGPGEQRLIGELSDVVPE